jgi:hypothetical protein
MMPVLTTDAGPSGAETAVTVDSAATTTDTTAHVADTTIKIN